MGRPITTSYSDEERDEIAAHVIVNVSSGRFVSRIFREDMTTEAGIKLPHIATFWKWVMMDDDLDDKLTRARERGIEALLDETLDIADEVAFDTILDDSGGKRANSEWITRSRLRVDTRVKLAQMLKPKKYGAKLDLTSGGETLSDGLDPVARATRLAAIFASIEKRRDESD